MLTEAKIRSIEPLRYSRKIADSGGLYLLVSPKGGRVWRFNYRFDKKARTLALGCYPDVSLELARHRHAFARHMLAHRLDPGVLKAALGKWVFLGLMGDWQRNEGRSVVLGDRYAAWLQKHSANVPGYVCPANREASSS